MAETSTEREDRAAIMADSPSTVTKMATNRKDRPSKVNRFLFAVEVSDPTSSPAPARNAVRVNDSIFAHRS